jgi:hypothetical protein
MEIAYFVIGGLFSTAQFLLARKVFNEKSKPVFGALYVFQRLILSMGLLVLAYLVSTTAILFSAIGLIATAVTLPLIFNRKR